MGRIIVTQGQVWEAWVPFHEKPEPGNPSGKFRPVIILGWALNPGEDKNILITYSTQFSGDSSKANTNDYKLKNPSDAGLTSESFIRCGRLMSISTANINSEKYKGSLSKEDFKAVAGKIFELFDVPSYGTI